VLIDLPPPPNDSKLQNAVPFFPMDDPPRLFRMILCGVAEHALIGIQLLASGARRATSST
jgi:hypothetical protein